MSIAHPPRNSPPSAILPTMLGDASVPSSPPLTARVLNTAHDAAMSGLSAGDSVYHPRLLTADEADIALARLGSDGPECTYQQWHAMPRRNKLGAALHRLRRVKIAMAVPDAISGRIPHYRFPVNDQQRHGVRVPMTPTVDLIRRRVETTTGLSFNHAVVLL